MKVSQKNWLEKNIGKLVFLRLEVGLISGAIFGSRGPKTKGVVNLRNKRTKICSITTVHNHIRQASSAHSIIKFGQPPSFDPARFSQTATLRAALCKYRESGANSKFQLFRQKKPFGQVFSKITSKTNSRFSVSNDLIVNERPV